MPRKRYVEPLGRVISFRPSKTLEAGFDHYRQDRGRVELRHISPTKALQRLVAAALRAWAVERGHGPVARYIEQVDLAPDRQPDGTGAAQRTGTK